MGAHSPTAQLDDVTFLCQLYPLAEAVRFYPRLAWRSTPQHSINSWLVRSKAALTGISPDAGPSEESTALLVQSKASTAPRWLCFPRRVQHQPGYIS